MTAWSLWTVSMKAGMQKQSEKQLTKLSVVISDRASRGMTMADLKSSTWFTGPKFLREKDIVVPKTTPQLRVRDSEVKVTQVLQTIAIEEERFLNWVARFSKWHTALNVVACIQKLTNGQKTAEPINVEYRRKASLVLVRLAQKEAFKDEIHKLTDGKLSQNHQLFQLDPVLQDSVLRVGGWWKKDSLLHDVKPPVILPKDGVITRLILSHCHGKSQHQSRGQTPNELRANGYWEVRCSKIVANSIKQCVTYRRAGRPTETQKTANHLLTMKSSWPLPSSWKICGRRCLSKQKMAQGTIPCRAILEHTEERISN